ncbi:hypothetical protein BX661DRAFT_183362 [Kickxella alabastrina]|uniref:uncharacterized protein n=1 Tax=Kickxella alabastrina TaxID=61397 RepID=UPI00221F8ADD|nr:uncharacterized protein BX661DRAFT_183362 [Kickxella alabastrina]KAI7826734.1 hypothetical protein BX661DRAFT_183362 [Kickxella alabastrina]
MLETTYILHRWFLSSCRFWCHSCVGGCGSQMAGCRVRSSYSGRLVLAAGRVVGNALGQDTFCCLCGHALVSCRLGCCGFGSNNAARNSLLNSTNGSTGSGRGGGSIGGR